MSEKQPKKKKTAGDVVLTVVLIAAICVFCYAGYNLFHIYTEYKKEDMILIHYKDAATAFNNIKKATIENKGVLNKIGRASCRERV